MQKAKIAISLPRELLASARAEVRRGRAKSVSAYVASAVREKVEANDLNSLLEEMLRESGGPMTAAEEKWAERTLKGKSLRQRKHK